MMFAKARAVALLSAVSGVALLASGQVWAKTGDTAAQTAGQTTDQTAGQTTGKSDDNLTIVVTGQRKALETAEQRKKKTDQIVDSITAVDIGALPDRSVTEALQRVPGVTIGRTDEPRDIDRLNVEGSGVMIRGLTWVRSEINGRDSFGAKNGRSLGCQ